MSREEKNAALIALVERFRASGTTQEQFSKNHGVALTVLRCWLAKTRSETEGPGFIQLDGIIQQEFRIASAQHNLAATVPKKCLHRIVEATTFGKQQPYPPSALCRSGKTGCCKAMFKKQTK